MLAANYDITLDRAAEYSFVLTIKDSSDDPQPIDVGANEFYADLRNAVSKEVVASFDVSLFSDGSDGAVVISLTESDTLLLNSSTSYEWDLFMLSGTSPDTISTRLLYGSVTVRQNTTKGVPVDPTA